MVHPGWMIGFTGGLLFLAFGCQVGTKDSPAPRLIANFPLDEDAPSFGQVVFSADGKTLAAGSSYPWIYLWDVNTQKVKTRFRLPADVGYDNVSLSPDGKLLSSTLGKKILLGDLGTKKINVLVQQEEPFRSLAFSPDSKLLAFGDEKGVTLWDLAAGKVRHTFKTRGTIIALAFSPDGKLLAGGGGQGHVPEFGLVDVWDVPRSRLHNSLKGIKAMVCRLAFSPNGKSLVSLEDSDKLRLWNIETAEQQTTWRAGLTGVTNVLFSPNGRLLAIGGGDSNLDHHIMFPGWVKFYEPDTRKELFALKIPEGNILSLAFSPDRKLLAINPEEGGIQLWDVSGLTKESGP